MKTLVLALFLCPSLLAAAQAETFVTGFNPRFSTAPQNPDEPDYRPPYTPASRFDVTIDVDPRRYRGRDDREDCRRRHRRD